MKSRNTAPSKRTFNFFPGPRYSLIQGSDTEAFLDEFSRTADAQYKDVAGNVKVLGYDAKNRTAVGSNPFAVVHTNRVMRGQGIQTATPAEIEAFRDNLHGTYEDSALVLRSAGDSHEPNDYLAKNLAKQLRGRLGKKVGRVPIVIPLVGLDLVRDGKSSYGLAFKLREDAAPYEAPILAEGYNAFLSEDVDVRTGLPTKLGSGNRGLWTRKDGLSRLYLNRGLVLDSYDRGLAGSDSDGRVVVSASEARRTH